MSDQRPPAETLASVGSAEVLYRHARPSDAVEVAHLHADSWRAHYRGAYSDAFLDGDVVDDRVAFWTRRLGSEDPDRFTLLARSRDGLIGFAHTALAADPEWGALLENLHVARCAHRRGVGRRLMGRTAGVLLERSPSEGLHLWVLEQNRAARAFYEALGGSHVDSSATPAPGGDPARLAGTPMRRRYAWRDPRVLLAES
ncbi:MAG TPA: GNAT family N-acetyltransferase [Solirubrobacteraceae bacterium]|nr:GNAT family N-acetyltransferase [Solirubrobacteraceae bacterium]